MGCCNSKSNSNSKRGSKTGGDIVLETTNSPLSPYEIECRVEASKVVQTINLGDIAISYAWLSQRGYYPDGKLFFRNTVCVCASVINIILYCYRFEQRQSGLLLCYSPFRA